MGDERAGVRWLVRAWLGGLACAVLVVVWGFGIEPYWIEVTRHRIEAPPGSGLAEPITIAHLTDLHTAGVGRRERAMLRAVEAAGPDVIVVTGDTVAASGSPRGYGAVWEALARLGAPLGVVGVRGNWEYWAAPAGSEAAADAAGITTLVNGSTEVRGDVWLLGTDDGLAGQRDQAATAAGVPGGVYRVGLVHEPEWAGEFGGDADLLLAGHTHGGQIVLPLWGPPWLPPGSGDYVAGWYEVGGVPLYVSRGLGTSILPVRLFCRPEVAIIEVVPGR